MGRRRGSGGGRLRHHVAHITHLICTLPFVPCTPRSCAVPAHLSGTTTIPFSTLRGSCSALRLPPLPPCSRLPFPFPPTFSQRLSRPAVNAQAQYLVLSTQYPCLRRSMGQGSRGWGTSGANFLPRPSPHGTGRGSMMHGAHDAHDACRVLAARRKYGT